MAADHYEAEAAEFSIYKGFQGLHRDSQAVLGFATIQSLRSDDCTVSIRMVSMALGLPIEAVEACIDDLSERGLAWRTGDLQHNLDLVQTSLAIDLAPLAMGPGGRPSAKAWRELREIVFARDFAEDRPCCTYCGASDEELVLDHIIPVSRGGSNHPTNLTAACVSCNGAKGAKTYSEFLKQRRDLIRCEDCHGSH